MNKSGKRRKKLPARRGTHGPQTAKQTRKYLFKLFKCGMNTKINKLYFSMMFLRFSMIFLFFQFRRINLSM